jgi:acetyl esterase/lipase
LKPELAEQIARQEKFFAPLITTPEGATFVADELDGVPVEWTTAASGISNPAIVILYLHGGGYSSGLSKWARRASSRLVQRLGCRVVAPDYRLAPRFPFPAAHEDVLTVYRWLIGKGGYAPQNVIVGGDSAGGALTVSLLADARDTGLPLPGCGLINSLWADIAMHTPSLDDPVKNRYDIRRSVVEGLSATLLSTGGVDPCDPRHSPVYRDLRGLPPLLIQVAGRDICHDDSIRLAANAKQAGVTVKVTEYADVEHIWILNGTHRIHYPNDTVEWYDCGVEPPEAVTAIDEMCEFVRTQVRAASATGVTTLAHAGTWQLVPEVCIYQSGEAPRDGTYVIALQAGRADFTIAWTTQAGEAHHAAFGGWMDGSRQPVAEGSPAEFSIESSGDSLDSAVWLNGERIAFARRRVSADGALLSTVQEGIDSSGNAYRNFQVYRRSKE